MPVRRCAAAFGLLGGLLVATLPHSTRAQSAPSSSPHHHVGGRHTHHATHIAAAHSAPSAEHRNGHRLSSVWRGKKSYAHRASLHVIQCVPFARAASGIALRGNANLWWDEAAGLYARGSRPEVGAVLAFRANRAMRLGHVAVVSRVINAREIEIDHAHWASNGVSRNITVIDVSPNNDWTLVRVALGHNGSFGSVYATHGFIYNRPAGGEGTEAETVTAAASAPASLPAGGAEEAAPVPEIAAAPPPAPLSQDVEAPLRSYR